MLRLGQNPGSVGIPDTTFYYFLPNRQDQRNDLSSYWIQKRHHHTTCFKESTGGKFMYMYVFQYFILKITFGIKYFIISHSYHFTLACTSSILNFHVYII